MYWSPYTTEAAIIIILKFVAIGLQLSKLPVNDKSVLQKGTECIFSNSKCNLMVVEFRRHLENLKQWELLIFQTWKSTEIQEFLNELKRGVKPKI